MDFSNPDPDSDDYMARAFNPDKAFNGISTNLLEMTEVFCKTPALPVKDYARIVEKTRQELLALTNLIILSAVQMALRTGRLDESSLEVLTNEMDHELSDEHMDKITHRLMVKYSFEVPKGLMHNMDDVSQIMQAMADGVSKEDVDAQIQALFDKITKEDDQ